MNTGQESAFSEMQVNGFQEKMENLYKEGKTDKLLDELGIRGRERNAYSAWFSESKSIESFGEFHMVDKEQFDLLCFVELSNTETKTNTPVTVRFVKEEGWRLVSISFGQ